MSDEAIRQTIAVLIVLVVVIAVIVGGMRARRASLKRKRWKERSTKFYLRPTELADDQ